MSIESAANELRLLIKQTKEHVSFFQELDVSGIALTTDRQVAHVDEQQAKPPVSRATVSSDATLPSIQTGRESTEIPLVIPRRRTLAAPSPADLFGELPPAAKSIAKSGESMEQVWADIGDCMRCSLHEGRTHIVHTEGTSRARLMFVGEAPGADEDMQARPFVGRAGQLLTKIIESIGFRREEVLIGNINRCRPPANRPPTPDEVSMCKPFLLREIAAVRPEVIVVLGNTAMKNLLDVKEGITKLRGIFQDYQGIKIMPTFHPAYLLRDPSKKRETWEDLKKVRDYLDSTARREN
ncbi:MAG TPA: uracil-DNA glycosylase [Pyrinomonadaceae bacterium]|nr:uracil-DNA glycosylase [Pyrinomonadaceae bacterium]